MLTIAFVFVVLTVFTLYESGALVNHYWKRDAPLTNPIKVSHVQSGVVTLEDGRALTPAGVQRLNSIPIDEYDTVLRIITAQGVNVVRDVDSSRAFLLAEPRFYNWCGTHSGWSHWAGSYLRCPVSELLVFAGYAEPVFDEPGLTPREQWRLEGVLPALRTWDKPITSSVERNALRYDGKMKYLSELDEFLDVMWKPAPEPW